MFVRFVVGAEAESPYWLTGVFTAAQQLCNEGVLHEYQAEWLNEVFEWFNAHLPCPPFKQKLRSGEWTADAVAWFRDDAGEFVTRMWEVVALLQEHGKLVRFVRTEKPGKIVYEDEYQVVAETPRWA